MCWQGSSNSVEKFSVRGDGLTTATTAADGVSAVVAEATSSDYAGAAVLVAQTTRGGDAGFLLFKVMLRAWCRVRRCARAACWMWCARADRVRRRLFLIHASWSVTFDSWCS